MISSPQSVKPRLCDGFRATSTPYIVLMAAENKSMF